jgi:hypothetical protein
MIATIARGRHRNRFVLRPGEGMISSSGPI